MGRYRSRSPRRSRTPTRLRRYDDPRERYRAGRSNRDRRSPAPSGLLVRNISLDARPEDLRVPFERYGPVKDVYLPKNYYTGEPRGFGFVKFRNAEDAAEAKHHLNHTVIGGREIAIVFAEENRKTPQEMRVTSRISGRSGGSYRRRSLSGSPRRRYRSYSRSPSPAGQDLRGRSHRGSDHYSPADSPPASREKDVRRKDYYSPSRARSVSRSISPPDDEAYQDNRKSKSPRQNERSRDKDHRSDRVLTSPRENGRNTRDKMEHGSERTSRSLRDNDRSLSRSPTNSYPHSRSYSP